MKPYVILGFPYTHESAGIRALHRLVHELNARGLEAFTTAPGNPEWDEPLWDGRPGITIYPEVIVGNPLGQRDVVRWALNTPGHLNPDASVGPDEYLWTWSLRYCNAPLLTVDVTDHDLFHDRDLKDTDTIYFGKGANRGVTELDETRHLTHIERYPNWPETHAETAALLRRTKTLYTYDDCTMIIDEALSCGCRVVLLPEGVELGWSDTNNATPEQHAERIVHFIEATQERFG